MKIRMNVVVMTLLVITGLLVWAVVKNQKSGLKPLAAVTAPGVEAPRPAKTEAPSEPMPQRAIPAIPVVRQHAVDEPAHIGDDDTARHIAQPGETVTSLAANLLGKDSKTNRDAIINANSSLKADPDKLVAGNSYRIPAAPEAAHADAVPTVPAPAVAKVKLDVTQTAHGKPATELKYTAATGDTVAKLSQAFLGSDDKIHQNTIINANPSLKTDPDRVVVGKSYRIPAPDGLSASAARIPDGVTPRPTTQPDADQVVLASSTRTLRYTARAGDTVTNLAIELLGSDTQETRDAIINNNPALKRDPDRVIAGQTYWIPAPVAATRNP